METGNAVSPTESSPACLDPWLVSSAAGAFNVIAQTEGGRIQGNSPFIASDSFVEGDAAWDAPYPPPDPSFPASFPSFDGQVRSGVCFSPPDHPMTLQYAYLRTAQSPRQCRPRQPPTPATAGWSHKMDYNPLVRYLSTMVGTDRAVCDADVVLILLDTKPLTAYPYWRHTARLICNRCHAVCKEMDCDLRPPFGGIGIGPSPFRVGGGLRDGSLDDYVPQQALCYDGQRCHTHGTLGHRTPGGTD